MNYPPISMLYQILQLPYCCFTLNNQPLPTFNFNSTQNQQKNSIEKYEQNQEPVEEKRRNRVRKTKKTEIKSLEVEESSYEVEKRPYSKRKQSLVKYLKCSFNECSSVFSSKIAMRNHQRLKHSLRIRNNLNN